MNKSIFQRKKCRTDVFDKTQNISDERLLIKAEFRTQNRILRLLKVFNLHKILPVNDLVDIKLSFENIGTENIKQKKDVDWYLNYPSGSSQNRKLNIPELKRGESCYTKPDWLFQPEVSGHHSLRIDRPYEKINNRCDGLKYAGEHGLVGRKYRLTNTYWEVSFYIFHRGEYITLLIIITTLLIALVSFLISTRQYYFELFNIINEFISRSY